jgi:hypothetical protein
MPSKHQEILIQKKIQLAQKNPLSCLRLVNQSVFLCTINYLPDQITVYPCQSGLSREES